MLHAFARKLDGCLQKLVKVFRDKLLEGFPANSLLSKVSSPVAVYKTQEASSLTNNFKNYLAVL